MLPFYGVVWPEKKVKVEFLDEYGRPYITVTAFTSESMAEKLAKNQKLRFAFVPVKVMHRLSRTASLIHMADKLLEDVKLLIPEYHETISIEVVL